MKPDSDMIATEETAERFQEREKMVATIRQAYLEIFQVQQFLLADTESDNPLIVGEGNCAYIAGMVRVCTEALDQLLEASEDIIRSYVVIHDPSSGDDSN